MTRSLSLATRRYSVQPRHQIFVKDSGKLVYISKNVSSQYSQKLLHHAKQSAANALKTASKRAIQKTAEATGDLIGNEIADKTTRGSKTSTKNNSATNKNEILRQRFIPLELRHKTTDNLRLREENY